MTTKISKSLLDEIYLIATGDTMTGNLTFNKADPVIYFQPEGGSPQGAGSNIIFKDDTQSGFNRAVINSPAVGGLNLKVNDAVGVLQTQLTLTTDGNVTVNAATPNDVDHLTRRDFVVNPPLVSYSETGISYGTTGAIALDTATGTYFYPSGTTTGVITFTFTNPAIATRTTTFTLEMLGAGNNNPVWPGSITWVNGAEPTWSTGTDIVSFFTRDNGTIWYGMPSILNDNTIDLNDADILNARSITFNGEIVNTGTTPTVDWTAGQKQKMTVTAATSVTLTAPVGQCNLTLKVINGGLGAITWPVAVKWQGGQQPAWTTSGTDLASFYFDGTNYYGMAGIDFI